MGLYLYETQQVFRDCMNECDSLLSKLEKDISVLKILKSSEIHQTHYSQPILFALEYSLAKLLISWEIKPSILIGHGIGEYVAACIAQIFSLEDALKMVFARAR